MRPFCGLACVALILVPVIYKGTSLAFLNPSLIHLRTLHRTPNAHILAVPLLLETLVLESL